MPLICVAVFAEEYVRALQAIERFGKKVDLVELRLDTADNAAIEAAVAAIKRPLILSCRPGSHGGRFKGSEAERVSLLRTAARFRPLYIDVELGTAAEELMRELQELPFILSFHDPHGMPGNLDRIAKSLFAKKPAMAKLVPRVVEWRDNLRILETAKAMRRKGRGFICFGAGEKGLYSRALAPACGSSITYCSVEGARPTGPGQFKLAHALELFRLDRITADWQVYGIVGNPVEHSFSPAFHNTLFAEHGIDAIYLPFRADQFQTFYDFARDAGISGLSVTAPFKIEAAGIADPGEDLAHSATVNTLVRSDAGFRSFNTDGTAFLAMLSEHEKRLEGKRILILGSGGVTLSLARQLQEAGALITICSRNKQQGREIAGLVGCEFSCEPVDLAAAHVVVNATSITKAEEDTDGFLSRNYPVGALAVDLHYEPPETFFLKEASLRGCRTVNGLEMFLRQAALQFKLWTGIEPSSAETGNIPLFKL